MVLKDNWGRPRPMELVQFGGPERFVPWWDPARRVSKKLLVRFRRAVGRVLDNGAGRRSRRRNGARSPMRERSPSATAVGLLRMSAGGHFFSDVVFAGVFMFLLIWLVHGLLYRWRATRITDADVERALERSRGGAGRKD